MQIYENFAQRKTNPFSNPLFFQRLHKLIKDHPTIDPIDEYSNKKEIKNKLF